MRIEPSFRTPNEILEENFFLLEKPDDIAKLLEIRPTDLAKLLASLRKGGEYRDFTIPKKSGGDRSIASPSDNLKYVQRKLSWIFSLVYKARAAVHGFYPERGILTNAYLHSRKRTVLNLDLKDFFPSIHFGRIRGMFMAKPYMFSNEVASILANLCCKGGLLPQGAPTSPVISNMICRGLDFALYKLAKELRCTYTRYADDITFSLTRGGLSEELVVPLGNEYGCGKKLTDIIEAKGFKINTKKVRIRFSAQRQEVTGLVVNRFPNIKRDYLRNLRAVLYGCSKFGLDMVAKNYFTKFNTKVKIAKGNEGEKLKEVLRGKINFVREIKGSGSGAYVALASKFNNLVGETVFEFDPDVDIEKSRNIWIPSGASTRAMKVIKRILQTAQSEIFLVDNYLKEDFLPILESYLAIKPKLKVRLLVTHKSSDARDHKRFMALIARLKFLKATNRGNDIECREHKAAHARLFIIDNGRVVWSIGQGPAELGKKGEAATLWGVGDINTKNLLTENEAYWKNAVVIPLV